MFNKKYNELICKIKQMEIKIDVLSYAFWHLNKNIPDVKKESNVLDLTKFHFSNDSYDGSYLYDQLNIALRSSNFSKGIVYLNEPDLKKSQKLPIRSDCSLVTVMSRIEKQFPDVVFLGVKLELKEQYNIDFICST